MTTSTLRSCSRAVLIRGPTAELLKFEIGVPFERQLADERLVLHPRISDRATMPIDQILTERKQVPLQTLRATQRRFVAHHVGIGLVDEVTVRQRDEIVPVRFSYARVAVTSIGDRRRPAADPSARHERARSRRVNRVATSAVAQRSPHERPTNRRSSPCPAPPASSAAQRARKLAAPQRCAVSSTFSTLSVVWLLIVVVRRVDAMQRVQIRLSIQHAGDTTRSAPMQSGRSHS